MTQMIDMNKEDSYWRQVGLVYAQYRGILANRSVRRLILVLHIA